MHVDGQRSGRSEIGQPPLFPHDFEEFKIKRYSPSGSECFPPHVDVTHTGTMHRMVAVLWYLNDVDEGGETLVYQLVMPEEADVDKGMISTSSPIGRAILNKEEGDEIKVTTPAGSRRFELVKLTTIHDDA